LQLACVPLNSHSYAYNVFSSFRDVDTISDTGNLHTVGAELAVSMLLSSIARRNIAPNFVITRGELCDIIIDSIPLSIVVDLIFSFHNILGVFTCQYDLPPTDWDETEDGYNATQGLEQGECGK
jgi:hypothetical protein